MHILLMVQKSCTTWDVWNPVNSGINYLSTGAGFLPPTVSPVSHWEFPDFAAGADADGTSSSATWFSMMRSGNIECEYLCVYIKRCVLSDLHLIYLYSFHIYIYIFFFYLISTTYVLFPCWLTPPKLRTAYFWWFRILDNKPALVGEHTKLNWLAKVFTVEIGHPSSEWGVNHYTLNTPPLYPRTCVGGLPPI